MNNDNGPETGFLPDFCNLRTIFAVVIIAELLVFALVLAQPSGVDRWQALSLYSLYVQWIALGCTVLLCLTRNWLARLRPLTAGLAAWLMVMTVTAVVAALAWTLVLADRDSSQIEFMLRSLGLAAVVTAVVLRYFYLQQDWRLRVESASAARVEALQARIRPHFLFNSLNTIVSMIRSRPDEAERAVEDLADLFRASLDAGENLTTLEEELQLAAGYLQIEQMRLGDRLTVDWQVEGLPSQVELPPLTLQPLLENAVYHGIEPRREGGRILIRGRVDAGRVEICIENPVPDDHGGRSDGLGMAWANVRERLRLAFGSAGSLTSQQTDGLYSCCVSFPWVGGRGQGVV